MFWETRELPQQQQCWTPGHVAEVLRATCSKLADYLRRGNRSLYSSTCNDEQIFMRSTVVIQEGKRKQWQIGVTVIPTMTTDPICKFSAVQVATFASVDQPDHSVIIELDRDSDELGRIITTAFGEDR